MLPSSAPTVVGIGASAGGLAALKRFFSEIPEDSGLAFVVVMHLSPDHESHLAELLQADVRFPVTAVTQTLPLERNRVYVIPPNANLEAIDTHLRLTPLEERGRDRSPIDHFFRTLARTHDGHAVGVILTGTGSDGALGVKAIREKGGFTIVQAPDDAEYDGMPISAIATGLVDVVLPLREIPAAVLRFAASEQQVGAGAGGSSEEEAQRLIQPIFALLRTRTGRDFGRYKRSTIIRRIAHRMQLRQVDDLSAYRTVLREEPEEVRTLADDLLVTVTSFFRDPEVFEKLQQDVIPKLFAGKHGGDEVRVWSVGCATGEEPYSLAMLLLEEAARREDPPRVQVFASDLHERSLERARAGFYPSGIQADVGAERLSRFFESQDGGYRIASAVRDVVVFASHNLLGDPPFSRLDLISCRNLMIYLERDVQGEVLELFHYALRTDGFLVMGASESADRADLFRPDDKVLRIYQKRSLATLEARLPVFSPRASRPRPLGDAPASGTALPYGDVHARMVELYAPPSLLVGPDDRVVHLSQHAGRFLVHPGGEPTTSVYRLVREELRMELHVALDRARSQGETTRCGPILVNRDGSPRPVVLEVRPAVDAPVEGFALVVFDELEAEPDARPAAPGAAVSAAGGDRERALEEELEASRRRFQTLRDQYESNEEAMRTANEELQSANEELRSTLEELETSKEELQSINEELQTVNQENRHKVDELAQLSGDLQNLLAATDIATLFLDRDLRILRFTPGLGALFNVRGTDRGRPLSDITHRLGYGELRNDADAVLAKLTPVEREVRDEAGRWYLTRVSPYVSTSNRIEGVVITFVDITQRKATEDAVREARDYAEKIVETLPEPLLVLTPDLRVRSANTAFYEKFRVDPAATVGSSIYALGNGEWDIPSLRMLLEQVLPEDKVFNGYEMDHSFEHLGPRILIVNGRRLDHVQLILLGIQDVTETRRAEAVLREADRRKEEFLAMLSHELRNPLGALSHGLSLLQAAGGDPAALATTRERMERQLGQLVRLVDDLLDVSRISRGTLQLRRTCVDLVSLVRHALEEDRTQMADHVVQLDLPSEPIPVDADPARLAQVFANLLQNARKFTKRGGHIRIRAEQSGANAVVSVRDDGAGIPAERLSQIFEMFVSTDSSRDSYQPGPGAGLGIGLALARHLVELHGGTVDARSDGPDRGSEFVVRLPIADRAPAADSGERDARVAPPVSDRRILVVDDNEDAAESLAMLLRLEGNEVFTAFDGEEAVRASAEFRPDVVLLDIGLPKLDGYDVARRLRAQPGGDAVVIVAITGWGQEVYREKSRAAGIDHHLVKPIDRSAVWQILAQHPKHPAGR